jgi:hypothetical protein
MTKAEIEKKKSLARSLFLSGMEQTEIAEKVDVSRVTISKWCTADGWKEARAAKKIQFIELGKKVGVDELKNVLDAMQPQVKISTVLSYQGGKQQAQPSTYAKLSDVPSDALLEMREHNPEEYKRLYKAEYGMTCEI